MKSLALSFIKDLKDNQEDRCIRDFWRKMKLSLEKYGSELRFGLFALVSGTLAASETKNDQLFRWASVILERKIQDSW